MTITSILFVIISVVSLIAAYWAALLEASQRIRRPNKRTSYTYVAMTAIGAFVLSLLKVVLTSG